AKVVLRFAVEGAVEDELHRTAHQLGARPTYRWLRAVRTAAQARSVSGSLGCRRQREATDVSGMWASSTPGPAVDAGSYEGGEAGHESDDGLRGSSVLATSGHARDSVRMWPE